MSDTLEALRARVEAALSDKCATCRKREGEVNHPPGMIFVGWGCGWRPCPDCGGSTKAVCTVPGFKTLTADLLVALELAQAQRDEARKMLAECYVLSGADPDGNDWRHLWQTAVVEVRQTMKEHRADDGEVDRLRLRVAELEEKYCNHNVTAILTADGNNRLRGPA